MSSNAAVDAWKSKLIDDLFGPWSIGRTPGAAVRVIRHGEVVHRKEYGLADLEKKVPIGPDTSFLLASLTKAFTAMAIVILVERGDFSYETRLSEFFPQFPPYARGIAVRHLLRHTSGLREFEGLFAGRIDPDWPRSDKVPPAPSDFRPTSMDALELLSRQEELLFDPGDQFRYSNSGYVVLAQIVEKVSGERFPSFVRENIFRPIGMHQSLVYDETEPKVRNRARSYRRTDAREGTFEDIDYSPLNYIYGEDGVYTTVEDMVQWDRALYTGRLVKQSSLEEAFTPGKLNNGDAVPYGYGWDVWPDHVSHAGSWLGFNTAISRYRSRRFTVIVLANCEQLDADRLSVEIAKIYLEKD